MNRRIWVVAGVGVLLIALVNVLLGMNLVPAMGVAMERGTGPGWWLIWLVIAVTVACAVALAGFLIAAGLGKVDGVRS
jgi:hypothetical protein